MMLRLKTKFTLGLVFLFAVTLVIGMLGIFRIYQLSRNARLMLQQNHNSLIFSNNMLLALEQHPVAWNALQENLLRQQHNVTEPGEDMATRKAAQLAGKLVLQPENDSLKSALRSSILQISSINQQAILRKNEASANTAATAILSLSLIIVLLIVLSVIFIVSFPRIVTYPIRLLHAGIREISNKNYNTRIHLSQGDEFGELATVFNMMAGKLHDYEHSNLAQIRFEKTRIEAIINQMNDGIIGFDEHHQVLFMNAAATRLFGNTDVKNNAADSPLLTAIIRHPANKQLKINSDGQHRFFNKEIITVTNNGDAIGEVLVLRNITAFQELSAAKTKFIATASHELKTPISSMKMSLSLLSDERIGTLHLEQQQLLDSIGEDVERILQISTTLLDLAQEEVLAIETYPATPTGDIHIIHS
jgi:nitrogen fixation/metabolism regulation signal transduction histidine kinase